MQLAFDTVKKLCNHAKSFSRETTHALMVLKNATMTIQHLCFDLKQMAQPDTVVRTIQFSSCCPGVLTELREEKRDM